MKRTGPDPRSSEVRIIAVDGSGQASQTWTEMSSRLCASHNMPLLRDGGAVAGYQRVVAGSIGGYLMRDDDHQSSCNLI